MSIREFLRSVLFWILGLGVFIVVPVLTSPIAVDDVVIMKRILVFLIMLSVTGVSVFSRSKVVRWAVSAVMAWYFLYLIFTNFFERTWGLIFDSSYLLDFNLVWDTTTLTLGYGRSLVALLLLLLAFALAFLWWHRLWGEMSDAHISAPGVVSVLSAGILLYGILFGASFRSWNSTIAHVDAIGNEVVQQRINDEYVSGKENLFFVQLESVNALAANGEFVIGPVAYEGNFIPEMTKIAEKGVYFPHFFNNTFPTERTQQVILCGIIGFASGKSISFENCLPNVLRRSGYKTIAFRAGDLGFQGEGKFLRSAGFEEVHSKDIMEKGDERYGWGFDDCAFYQRSLDYLEKNYPNPEKLFVFIEVSSHHSPFKNRSAYAFADHYPVPSDTTQRYLNSLSEQDYCLKSFYEKYEKYARSNSHLFITGDHSMPMGVQVLDDTAMPNLNTDHFLTSAAYVPPLGRKKEFASKKISSEVLHSQTDYIPTIMELLDGKRRQNSFAYDLFAGNRPPTGYEKCHLLTMNTGGDRLEFAAVHDQQFFRFIYWNDNLFTVDMRNNLFLRNPELVSGDMDIQDFKSQYFCDRFK